MSNDVEPSVRVVEAVAEATGCDPAALPTLYDAVDVDALNQLLRNVDADETLSIRIEYAERIVEIEAGGPIRVSPQ
ncbi:HalOD1 output domain-containing protein [Salinarchaeum sp. Harcht-Bsk1]|uniref:HalOD1 output domain-containing protein n=1 Tax=Salinarchaeum sp. Harcht-Bsk1 TaxID=1333523 RepID=UPI0011818AE8|nr:HalOD1 output domain-containing protein [Salinarchaeum sp. Harcht-Bsk1]